MLLNGIINGVSVPVEVSEDELSRNGYHSMTSEAVAEMYRSEGTDNVKIKFLEYLVRQMDITSEQGEWLADSCAWEEFMHGLLYVEDEDFVTQVMSGKMLKDMNEYAESILPTEKLFEVSLDLSRIIHQRQTITVVIAAEDECDARSKLYDLTYNDIEGYTDEDMWDDYTDDDDGEICDWCINGETDNEDDFPIVEVY